MGAHTFAMALFSTTIVVYMQSRGLSLEQISKVNIVVVAGIFILEIPSGAYADIFGRKKCFIVSTISFILAFYLHFISANMIMFIIASCFIAIGLSFLSGSLEAWFMDEWNKLKSTENIDKIFTQLNFYTTVANLVGGVIGAYIAQYFSLGSPWLASAGLMAVVFLVSIFAVKEDGYDEGAFSISKGIEALKGNVKNGILYCLKDKVVFYFVCVSILSNFALSTVLTFWQPYFKNFNESFGISSLGWITVGMSLFALAGNRLVNILLNRNLPRRFIWVTGTILRGFPLLVIFYFKNYYLALFIYLLFYFGGGITGPVSQGMFNESIKSKDRATVLSFRSFFGQIGNMLGLLILGKIADYSIAISWVISGASFCLVVYFILLIFKETTAAEVSSRTMNTEVEQSTL